MKLYEITGTFVDVTFVNSTWTLEHIKKCWKSSVDMYPPNILYPPIGIDDEEEIDVELKREKIILYLAQFRGEKRHDLAIKEFAKFNESNPNNEYILQFIGSTRNEKDENLVSDLKKLAISLKIDNKIIFKLNESYNEIKKMMKISEFGLNTMWNEHFGISIVEYMANGMIPIVHASAGPLKDIVRSIDPKTKEIMSVEQGLLSSNLNTKSGFFFKDKSDPDYDSNTKFPTLSQVFNQISELKQDEKIQIRSNALYVYQKKFTNKEFQDSWIKAVKFTSKLEQYKRGLKGKVESVY
ncbi:glycosyltransferase family 4 protein [[Candida] arabinofermentans NRRL YB-2248]|uniref:Glycosyltransferase family 4 protein n=1 Tax=[Candida] arabinofermentans NRRL YB-2248 TaxID=983967 RepID=A0A1E4SW24_9ASCO|nr:glycosyltransferase family 4 protein [[Candida] arabinofermentans NRRL YB-2248]